MTKAQLERIEKKYAGHPVLKKGTKQCRNGRCYVVLTKIDKILHIFDKEKDLVRHIKQSLKDKLKKK